MTPDELRQALSDLGLSRRAAAALLELGRNGERSLLRMIRGQKHIPDRFAEVLTNARNNSWPDHFTPPAPKPPSEPKA